MLLRKRDVRGGIGRGDSKRREWEEIGKEAREKRGDWDKFEVIKTINVQIIQNFTRVRNNFE